MGQEYSLFGMKRGDNQERFVRAPQSLNGAARAQMNGVQRARLLAAAVEVVSEFGYGGMSMARVTTRAGVSRKTFYDLFEDREDYFPPSLMTRLPDCGGRRSGVRRWAALAGAGRAGLLSVLVFAGMSLC
jgi:predicted DNA-binding transcriptional regulator AlpA